METDNRLWTEIDGIKYDITNFIKNHPGGEEMVILANGRDATSLFYSYHRRQDLAKAVLDKLPKLGGTPKANTIDTPLYRAIKDRVNLYFTKNNIQSSRGNELMWAKSAALVAITCFVYYLTMIKGLWLLSPLLGVLLAINGLAIQHDANHGSFSKNKIVNRLASIVDDIIGGSSLIWRHQHVVLHHVCPNHVEIDGDSYSQYPIMRMNPKLQPTWYTPYQWLYGPFLLYSLLGLSYSFGDCSAFLSGKYLTAKLQLLSSDKAIFWGGKILHHFLFIVVPVYLHGWTALFKLYVFMELFGSNFLASLFAVSHNTTKTLYNLDAESDWAELQIRTSANWSVRSTFWWLVSGGLNYQIEHHLFPGVSHIHYPAISKIVQQVCKEKKLPYNAYNTFGDIYKDHLALLKQLGSSK